MALTRSQKNALKAKGHALKPVVMVGDKGLTDAVVAEVDAALAHHELIKVQIRVGDRAARDEIIETIRAKTSSNLVQRIGNVALLYKRHPEKPKVLG